MNQTKDRQKKQCKILTIANKIQYNEYTNIDTLKVSKMREFLLQWKIKNERVPALVEDQK